MLKYTGHPLVDVGIATITAFANKRDPYNDIRVGLGELGRV